MRPHSYFRRFRSDLSACHHELPPAGDLAYNDRQKLPLGLRPQEGATLPEGFEFVVEPQQPKRDPSDSPRLEPGSAKAGETRSQRLARIRREIEAGEYETPEKLEAAVERMLGVLAD